MFAVSKYAPPARRDKYKGHCSNSSVRLPFTRRDGYGRFDRSSRNDLCVRYPVYNYFAWSNEVRGSAKRGLSRIRNVLHTERDDHQPKSDHKKHVSLLDRIRDYSLTKSSRVLKRDMKYLIVGPGAMGFYAILGSVYALHNYDKLKELESVAGSSAGSIVAFGCLVAKWDIIRLFKIIKDVDVNQLMRLNLKSLLNNYGLVPASRWKDVFSKICMELAGKEDFTFQELKEWSGLDFYVSAYNITLQKSCYFSHHTHPDMSVSHAVCMSISIPFLFESVMFKDHRYVDSAAFETCPLTPFMGKDMQEVVSIELDPEPSAEKPPRIGSFVDFIQHFITSIMRNRVVYEKPTIYIKMKEGEAFNFSMDDKNKKELFYQGYITGKRFLKIEHEEYPSAQVQQHQP
jgi:predicted acylesterase/phospholipase RssA